MNQEAEVNVRRRIPDTPWKNKDARLASLMNNGLWVREVGFSKGPDRDKIPDIYPVLSRTKAIY